MVVGSLKAVVNVDYVDLAKLVLPKKFRRFVLMEKPSHLDMWRAKTITKSPLHSNEFKTLLLFHLITLNFNNRKLKISLILPEAKMQLANNVKTVSF